MDLTNFYLSLEVMGQGMLGIFFFMGVFYGMIVLLEKVFPAEKKQNG